MKRTLSLILALAMVMSLFTTVSFAAGKTLAGTEVKSVSTTTLPVEYNSSTSKATVYYMGSAPTLSGLTYKAVLKNDTQANATYKLSDETHTIEIDNTSYYATLAAQEVKVTLATKTGGYTVEGTQVQYVGATEPTDAQLDAGVTKTITGASGLTATLTTDSSNNILATVKKGDATWFTSVDTGYDFVRDQDVVIEIVNGNSINASTILSYVKTKLGNSSLTSINLTIPAASGGITVYSGSTAQNSTSLNGVTASTNLTVYTTAGTIGTRELTYVAGSNSGKITIKSVYDTAITVSQAAPFYNEEFDLDPISGIYKLGAASAVSVAGADASYTDWQIAPGTTTKTYTGYTSANVAKQVTVNFTYPSYDLISYVDDGETPFSSDYIESFADSVFAEQISSGNIRYYSGYLDKVSIHNVSAANQYTLYLGNSKLTTAAITPAQLDTVTMDVLKAGTYYIDFTAYYKYANTSSSSYTSTSYTGRIIVYAGNTGDLSYEVAHGDTVNFKTLDFQQLYRRLAGTRYSLSYVEIDALPLAGGLYKANRMTNAYAVSVDDKFYVNPTTGQNDLNALLYWASTSYTSEYSVNIPVTMYGTGGFKSAVVEIVVNDGDIPFTDIPKTHTFYEYIRYVYNHDIMNGKSAYRFDASSSITRAQLVTTLYRMAGSPTTYNSRTLPFTDTKTLSTEFSNAVKWAYYNKIVGGTSATTFAPNAAITRQAMVKILYGYAKAYGMSTGVEYNNHIGYYTDGGSVSTSMKDAMNWALDYGLLSGNNSKLNPRGSTTRGAAAKILANFHEDFIG